MEDKSAKKEVVKAAAPALHNGIPADCDMSMTRCDLATNSAEPARGAPGGIDHPLMDPENAAGFIQQRRTTGLGNFFKKVSNPLSDFEFLMLGSQVLPVFVHNECGE